MQIIPRYGNKAERLRLSLDEVLNALNEASEGREWYGPKPDLLSNALNRAIKRKAEASLAEPVEAGAGQSTPIMALRQRLDVACDSEGYLHRTEMNKVINEWIENSAWHWGMDVRTQPRNLAERFQLIAKALNAKDYKTAYEHAHSGYYDAVTGPEEPPAGEPRPFEQWWMDWRYKNPKEEAAWAAKAAWNAALATREAGKEGK